MIVTAGVCLEGEEGDGGEGEREKLQLMIDNYRRS